MALNNPLRIYNTLSKKKEDFIPFTPGKVGMYQCGPTVYWTQHIGNMRAVFVADITYRTLQYVGYDVMFVRNYTDVGHLTGDNDGDADTGEDRMEKAAKREGTSPEEIAQKYTDIYNRDIERINTLPPDHAPAATDHITQMIAMTEILLAKKYAYTTDLAVYFDISQAKEYTRLSGQNIEENISGAGTGDVVDPQKRNPQDFALWFFKAGEHAHALQTWMSPFKTPLIHGGEGFPGWHIECSAMAKQYLGDSFEIHIGGVEHISIHHTNEIAQSESANDKEYVKYWMHNEHLLYENGKMSKSGGTAFSIDELIEKGFDPLSLRYFFLQAHYRSKQNFTWDALEAAQNGLEKFYKQFVGLGDVTGSIDEKFRDMFVERITDDFNTAQALTIAHDVLKSELSHADKRATLLEFDLILGLNLSQQEKSTEDIPEAIKALAKRREEAREEKDFDKADELRNQISELGFDVQDGDKGPVIVKK